MNALALWLVGAALAGVRSETVLQVRHDLFDEAYVPAWQTLDLSAEHHGVSVDGYAGLEWATGLDKPADPDLYLLTASGRDRRGTWTIGRQQAVTLLRPWTFDGAAVRWRPTGNAELAAWGGWARHQDLDDLRDGAGLARLEGSWARGSFATRAGAWTIAAPETGPSLHQDAEIRWLASRTRFKPGARALVVGRDGAAPLEWARFEFGANPLVRLRSTVHAQHREAIDPNGLLGEAIVAAFAPDGVDEIGGSLRWSGPRWSALSGTYARSTYQQPDQPVQGHSVDVNWLPPRFAAEVRLVPAYRFRSGPGGQFHAAWLSAEFDLSDATELTAHAAWVPYQKLDQPWTSATTAGLKLGHAFHRALHLQVGADVASDALFAFDLRGASVLTLELP
jgi:hypothetical protein